MNSKSEPRNLILGSGGFLGSYFEKAIGNQSTLHRNRIDESTSENYVVRQILNIEDLESLEIEKYQRVINCIAIASIEECETDYEKATWVNSLLPAELARICYAKSIRFIHFSTDAVFDGSIKLARESDSPNPKSLYGHTKLIGDNLVLRSNPDALILRVNFFGNNNYKSSLFNHFYNLHRLGKASYGYSDLFFTPTYAGDLVRMTLEMDSLGVSGLFHTVGNERISKYEFGKKIEEMLNIKESKMSRIPAASLANMKQRSLDLSLSNEKIRKLGIIPKPYVDGLAELIQELR